MHCKTTLAHLLMIITYLISTITAAPAATSTAVDLIKNTPHGGKGGKPFQLYAKSAGSPVISTTIWSSRLDGKALFDFGVSPFIISGIQVEFDDGSSAQAGVGQNDGKHDYKYEYLKKNGEKATGAAIGAGDVVDWVSIDYITKNGVQFNSRVGGQGGKLYEQEVGSGVLVGFEGTADDNKIISLGISFKAK